MTLHIQINPEIEAKLLQQAAALGEDINSYAARLLEEATRRTSLDRILSSVRHAFDQSGMSEDDLSDLLEHEKHAMRGTNGKS